MPHTHSTVNQDDAEPSSSSSQVRDEHENASNRPQQHRQTSILGWGFNYASSSMVLRDDLCSCVVVPCLFFCLVSMTIILGVYRSVNLVLVPNSSILLHPSPLFVQYVKVENLESKPGVVLYGTHGSPPLDVVTSWAETHNVSIPSKSYKEWKYYLNRGSELSMSYRLSSGSSSIFLVIAEGNKGLSQWMEDPTYPDTTLSWNMIHGTGMITQDIFKSSSYYVALGNLNEEVEVELNLRVRASLYNTMTAYYKCALTSSPCGLSIFFQDGNTAVLVSPGPQQNTSNDEWHVKLSYGPRWVTYIFGMGGITLLMFSALHFLNKLHYAQEDRAEVRHEETSPQRAPLLSQKDDDCSSSGSSYDSMPHDEEDLEFLTRGSIDGKSLGDGGTSNNTWHLCAICFDAPRDCFFLPCGHCVACFACGTRISEAAGTCPICRRKMKKVRKIFTV